jgi:hypothetical protein
MLREDGNLPDRSKHPDIRLPHRRHHRPDPYLVSPPALSRGAAGQVFAPRPGRVLASIDAGGTAEIIKRQDHDLISASVDLT